MLNSRNTNIVFTVLLLSLMITDNYREIPMLVYCIALLLYGGIQAYGSAILSAQFFVPVFSSGCAESNAVALTFDDGPIRGKTEAVLDVLDRYKIKASFFCIGNRVKENPEMVVRIHTDGHIIANHSYWHSKLFDLQTAGSIGKELQDTDTAIFDAIGVKPKFFRPPYGVTNPMVATAIRQGQYKTIGWSVRSLDTVIKDPDVLFDRVTSKLKAGDVILFHDSGEATINILPRLIVHIQKSGLRIVTLEELLNQKAYA